MDKETKQKVISQFRLDEKDNGSTEVQVAVLTSRINQLTTHMTANQHDYDTKRSLLKFVGQRRNLLGYLKKEDEKRYQNLITRLGLRK